MSQTNAQFYGHAHVDAAWLDKVTEEILEPDLPIIDPHHHLWHDRPSGRYMPEQLFDDLASGHNIVATVCLQCGWMHRPDGPEELRPAGETEAVNATAVLSATGAYGPARACAGIVGWADLRSPLLDAMLDAHEAAGGGRFRGVGRRHPADQRLAERSGPAAGRAVPGGAAAARRARRHVRSLAVPHAAW